MPTKDEHLQKARDNEGFAGTLDTNSQASVNWTLVILFYTALHYVEAYLAQTSGKHIKSHTTRDKEVATETNLCRIRAEYCHLKYYGYNARYEPDQFTDSDIGDALQYLAQVKNVLLPLL